MKLKKIGQNPPKVSFRNKPQDSVNMNPLASQQQVNQPNTQTSPNMMQNSNSTT